MLKKKIRVAITDIGPHAEKMSSAVLSFVSDQFDFEITKDLDAEFVLHSCLGYDVLRYRGVRIFITEENVSPNFNISDYALAFDRMEFGDRYVWLPLIKLYQDAYRSLLATRRPVDEVLPAKTSFCSYVMSSTRDSAQERIRIFDLLSDYKQVNSGGKWNNNVGGPVPNKLEFQSSHKFVIAFENMSYAGYVTEKFSEAVQADAIPIYWGDPTIGDLFNPKAFVNCHDYQSLEEAVARVKEIDQDDNLYQEMLSESLFLEGREPECLHSETFSKFLGNIFAQEPSEAYRRNRGRWGVKQEKNLKRMYQKPLEHGVRQLRRSWLERYHKIVPRKKYQGLGMHHFACYATTMYFPRRAIREIRGHLRCLNQLLRFVRATCRRPQPSADSTSLCL